jgi:hypothetical protein
MYLKGCRCQECRLAEAAYKRLRKAGKIAPTRLTALPSLPSTSVEPGRAEAAVCAEIDALPAGEPSVALIEFAKTLARDLDDKNLAASHASLSRELRATLDLLRAGVRHHGKLHAIAALSSSPTR